MGSKDKRLIQQASMSSLLRVAIPVAVGLFLVVNFLNGMLSRDEVTFDQTVPFLLLLGILVIAFFAIAASALVRRVRVSRVISAPQAISRIEQSGDKVTIRLSDGKAIEFAVKRTFPLPSANTTEVLAALGRIAPHAMASSAN